MDREQRAQREREDEDVDAEEAAHRRAGDVRPAPEEEQQLVADQRDPARDLGAHHGRPVRALVPREQVAREAEAERDEQQPAAHHPGQLARVLVGGLEEDPAEMERDDRIIRFAAQWWTLRISQPKLTSLVIAWTLL